MVYKRMFLVLVALALAFGVAASPGVQPALAQVEDCTQYHTVKRGESLYQIGRIYGVSWQDLADLNNLRNPRLIFAGTRLCVSTEEGGTGGVQTPSNRIPTFSIVSVVADQSVTIRTNNFPANDIFNVLMGEMGTRGIGGIRVKKFDSDEGGVQQATFTIPAELRGERQIAIRLQSPTSGFFAYNWFWNNTTGGTGGTGGVTTPGGYSGFPTFSISSVVRNDTVTIRGRNFPPNDTFTVLMDVRGGQAIGGIQAGSYSTGSGGSFTATFDIPAELQDVRQIAIRLQSPTSGYFAYNWFWNNNAP